MQFITLDDDDNELQWWDENDGEEAAIIFAGAGLDLVAGDAGDDFIYGQGDRDWLFGGPFAYFSMGTPFSRGLVTWPYDLEVTGGLIGFWGNDTISGGDGDDDIGTGSGNDTLFGGPGGDSMYAGGGNDILYPGIGATDRNTMYGGDGNDIFYAENNEANWYNGGNGIDWVIFGEGESLDSSPVTVDLLRPQDNAGQAQGDTYIGIENLRGSWSADILAGDNNANILEGGPGNAADLLFARGGDDIVRGGDGDDNLYGGDGADWIDGGNGFDTANYQDSPVGLTVDFMFPGANTGYAAGDKYAFVEHLIGSQHADGLGGDDNFNIILGGAGNDFIGGRGGDDQLWGESDDDILTGDGGADQLHGGPGNDWAIYWYAPQRVLADLLFPGLNNAEPNDAAGDTYDQIENLGGSQFDDRLGGDNGANIIKGLDGNDLIAGRGGNDQLFGEGGDDILLGEAGAKSIDGGADIDQVIMQFRHLSLQFDSFNPETGRGTLSGSGYSATLSGVEAVAFAELQHGGLFYAGGAQYADLNDDGRADLIYQGVSNIFWVSLSSGNGFFSPQNWLQHGGTFAAGEAQYADVNGDGRADLIYQGKTNSFWVSLSTGGGFASPSIWMQHGGSFEAGHAQYADVDGDGKADLIFQGAHNEFWVSKSNGASFDPAAPLWVQHGGTFAPGEAQFADVNGDGKADLIYQGKSNAFYVSLSTGNGFTAPAQWMQHGGTFQAGHAQYADVDGDGRADLIFQGALNQFWVSKSNGTSFDPAAPLWVQHGGAFAAGEAQYADMNGDGKADLIFLGKADQVWESLSTGSRFTDPVEVAHFDGSFVAGQFKAADVSGDHHADLLMQTFNNQFLLSLNGADFHVV